jgi:hypothetical protein
MLEKMKLYVARVSIKRSGGRQPLIVLLVSLVCGWEVVGGVTYKAIDSSVVWLSSTLSF